MALSAQRVVMKRYGQWLITIVLCLTALLIMGCGSTFLISKDCKTYYFGEVNGTTYEMLCLSGDIELILEGTSLPPETRVAIYRSHAQTLRRQKCKPYTRLSAPRRRRTSGFHSRNRATRSIPKRSAISGTSPSRRVRDSVFRTSWIYCAGSSPRSEARCAAFPGAPRRPAQWSCTD